HRVARTALQGLLADPEREATFQDIEGLVLSGVDVRGDMTAWVGRQLEQDEGAAGAPGAQLAVPAVVPQVEELSRAGGNDDRFELRLRGLHRFLPSQRRCRRRRGWLLAGAPPGSACSPQRQRPPWGWRR